MAKVKSFDELVEKISEDNVTPSKEIIKGYILNDFETIDKLIHSTKLEQIKENEEVFGYLTSIAAEMIAPVPYVLDRHDSWKIDFIGTHMGEHLLYDKTIPTLYVKHKAGNFLGFNQISGNILVRGSVKEITDSPKAGGNIFILDFSRRNVTDFPELNNSDNANFTSNVNIFINCYLISSFPSDIIPENLESRAKEGMLEEIKKRNGSMYIKGSLYYQTKLPKGSPAKYKPESLGQNVLQPGNNSELENMTYVESLHRGWEGLGKKVKIVGKREIEGKLEILIKKAGISDCRTIEDVFNWADKNVSEGHIYKILEINGIERY